MKEESLKDKSFKRVLWLSPSERWRFRSAKPAPIPQERMLSLCESHGHKNGISTQIFAKRNISQLKLALDLNMNQNSISRYENREREAELYGLFEGYFCYDGNDMLTVQSYISKRKEEMDV